MEVGLKHEFSFMLGLFGVIFITRVLPDDVTSLGQMNYLWLKAVLKGGSVLEVL